MFRNFIGIMAGLVIATGIITSVISLDSRWMEYRGVFPYEHWRTIVKTSKDELFIALLAAAGIGSLVGGIVTAMIVKRAKQAYAMLIGFILFIIAILDIIFITDHPTFYEIGLFFVFFPCSWLGGKIVDMIYKKTKYSYY